jgi:hypothetical protein
MNVSREISIYEKYGSALIESFVTNIPVETLAHILNVKIDDDPNLYKVYPVNEIQYSMLMQITPELKGVDFNSCEVFYECFQI